MTDSLERAVIVERMRALRSEQAALLEPFTAEIRRWEGLGLDLGTAFGLAIADSPPELFQRIKQLGDQLLATLRGLEAVDPTGPGEQADLAERARWALGIWPKGGA